MSNKLVLAIDSSLACPAFALLEFNLSNYTVRLVEVTHVKTNPKHPTGQRLAQIHDHVESILTRHQVTDVVFEKGFNKFAVATQQIQRTVGLLLFTLYRNSLTDINELSPTSVKKYITGNGKASKEELANALNRWVGERTYKTNDESDSVGVGLAYGIQRGWI